MQKWWIGLATTRCNIVGETMVPISERFLTIGSKNIDKRMIFKHCSKIVLQPEAYYTALPFHRSHKSRASFDGEVSTIMTELGRHVGSRRIELDCCIDALLIVRKGSSLIMLRTCERVPFGSVPFWRNASCVADAVLHLNK